MQLWISVLRLIAALMFLVAMVGELVGWASVGHGRQDLQMLRDAGLCVFILTFTLP